LNIPTRDEFIADYNAQFGADPALTPGETALFNQAVNAPQRAVLPERTFPITSGYGYIIPGNAQTFDGFNEAVDIDLDGNGNPDCLDSYSGYNSSFAPAAFGVVGGCWNVLENGTYRPVRDGLVSGNFSGFGGDSFNTIQNRRGDIVLPDEKITINILGHYDVTPEASVFAEFKYVKQETDTDSRPNSFYDLLPGFSDNPFLPSFIQPVADAIGAVAITIDPLAFPNDRSTDRDTTRVVLGIEGAFKNGWTYEVSGNYGLYKQENRRSGGMIIDRFFAAIDAVTDPATGQAACRVDVDPSAPGIKTPFDLPAFDPGYYSFTPGSGACVPLNIWAGQGGVTADAIAFVTTPESDRIDIDQLVFSALISGDLEFELPGGPISFAAGVEYRKETSKARFDTWQRGIIPAGSPFPQGTKVSDVSDNAALTFDPEIPINNENGEYNVTDVFVEASLPILSNIQFAKELSLDLAIRTSNYSTIGNTTTWKVNVVWAPVDDVAFRGGVSRAVRAPNITELFGPETGTTFRPADPCDAAQIAAIAVDDATLAANTQANCVADLGALGLNPIVDGVYTFTDPLSARIGGIQGGNRDLTEETADTVTFGFVFQPHFLSGFSLTVDYWDIEIEDAIEAVSGQNIVDGCYQAPSLNQNFCQLFTRNTDPVSAQFGGFSFLRSTKINFARLETSGIDFAAAYNFNLGDHGFEIKLQGSDVDQIDFFTNPADLSAIDDELGEVNRPKQAGNVYLNWDWGNWHVGWQAQYVGDQLLRFVEIDTAKTLYGNAVFMDSLWIHDLNARYVLNDSITVYGGVNNITEENPFGTNRAYPASPRGRYYFFGVNYQI
jgi:iron complex outermembrane recepter protein